MSGFVRFFNPENEQEWLKTVLRTMPSIGLTISVVLLNKDTSLIMSNTLLISKKRNVNLETENAISPVLTPHSLASGQATKTVK